MSDVQTARPLLAQAGPLMQLALDVTTVEEAVRVADLVAPWFEIIEAGTPLLFSEGMAAVKALKSRYPEKIILADMKIADAGDYEASLAFAVGADLVSVLGIVDPRTITGAVSAARRFGDGKGVVVDTLSVIDPVAAAAEFERLGAVCIELHAGTDQEHGASDLVGQLKKVASAVGLPVAIAGGLSPVNVGVLTAAGAKVFVVGSAVTRADDPTAVAKAFRAGLWATALDGGAGSERA